MTRFLFSIFSLGALFTCLVFGTGCHHADKTAVTVTYPSHLKPEAPSRWRAYGLQYMAEPGLDIVTFKEGTRRAAAILNVGTGGDIYVSIDEEDVVPVLVPRRRK